MKTFILNCHHSIEVDSYQNGELENVNNFDTNGQYKTETPIEAIEKHFYSLGYNFDKNYIDTDEEEENKIFYSVLCDEENDEATESQIELWKKDEKILYSNNMIIYVYELVSAKI